MGDSPPAMLGAGFTSLDWVIVAGFFIATTILGAMFAGKQATIRDFFLGGRKLPWYAVSGSIIATEISALTFVALPYVVFRPGGNFTYLQLGLFGTLFARLIVGYVLVPAYYQREIYSPYDYIGARLGEPVRKVTTILFAVGGVLSQSARVYLTALVLELILGDTVFDRWRDLTGISTVTWAIWTVGLAAVIWTLMGGIVTVIWTDVLLFLIFFIGALVSLAFVVHSLDGGWRELLDVAHTSGKLRLLDFDFSPAAQYTIWTAVIASTWHGIGAYGTDQMIAQRMFCCTGPREARRAIISSYAGLLVTVTVMLVGAGLYAYHQEHPLTGLALRLYHEDGNRIFPLFIIHVLPPGLTGLLMAAVFAAAISSLDSILAALSQTLMSAFYLPWRQRRNANRRPADVDDHSREELSELAVSRIMVMLCGVVLCLFAQLAAAAASHYPSVLDLGLAMAGYVGGALAAAFFLAFLPLSVDGRGLCWSTPLSVVTVFAFAWHQTWAQVTCLVFAGSVLVLWAFVEWRREPYHRIRRTGWLLLAVLLTLAASRYAFVERPHGPDGDAVYVTVAWPWYSVIGGMMAFVFGWLLAPPKPPANGCVRGLRTPAHDQLS